MADNSSDDLTPYTLSVVICTRNRPGDVKDCLPSVLDSDYPSFEIVVIDQSTNPETGEVVRQFQKHHPNLRYLPTDTVGKSHALNFGISQAHTDLMVFTDDDCEVPRDWLTGYARAFDADPELDVLFGPVFPSPVLAGREDICVPSWVFTETRRLKPGEVCGMGANMGMRRRALARLPQGTEAAASDTVPPYYDPILGPGAAFPAAEEGDMVYRLRKAGAVAALDPTLKAYHRAFRTQERWHQVITDYGTGDAAFWCKHIRCGDTVALGNLVRLFIDMTARAIAKTLLRRSHTDSDYVRGLWQGVFRSRRYAIDRDRRLYVP